MNTFKRAIKTPLTLITLFFIFTLAACGGGGGGGETTTEPVADTKPAAAVVPTFPALLGSKGRSGQGSITRFDLPSGIVTRVTGRGLAGYQYATAMAFDSNTGIFYAYDNGSEVLLTLDKATGAPTEVGPAGVPGIGGLAFDSATDTLFATSSGGLYTLNLRNGKAILVGNFSVSISEQSLAFHPPTGKLFTVAGAGINKGDLYSIDPATAVATLVGNIGATKVITSLTYNNFTQKLNGSDGVTKEMLAIDPVSAALTVLGPSGFDWVTGLAFDPTVRGGRLYAVESRDQRLMIVDGTGAATPIGSFGHSRVGLITRDTVSNVLYGFDFKTKHLVRVDRLTGETTDIGPTGLEVLHGMAYDPNSDTLYGLYSFQRRYLLLVFDRNTGAATSLGSVTGRASFDLGDLVFDPNSNTLYATNILLYTTELITIDTTTRVATLVNTISYDEVRGLAFDPKNKVMYGLHTITNELLVIDTTPGADPSGTVIGPVGFNVNWGLTFDSPSGKLLGTDQDNGADLLAINPATGTAHTVGSFGYNSVQALAFDRNTGTVYGVGSNKLLKIDPATGQTKVIELTGGISLQGLAYDPNLDILYGTGIDFNATYTLYTINTRTGESLAVGATGAPAISGLAFDPNTDTLYGATNSSLYAIDTSTGVGTSLGYHSLRPLGGLAFDYDTGTLYASKTFPYELYSIDLANLATTLVGSSDYRMDGLTYALVP